MLSPMDGFAHIQKAFIALTVDAGRRDCITSFISDFAKGAVSGPFALPPAPGVRASGRSRSSTPPATPKPFPLHPMRNVLVQLQTPQPPPHQSPITNQTMKGFITWLMSVPWGDWVGVAMAITLGSGVVIGALTYLWLWCRERRRMNLPRQHSFALQNLASAAAAAAQGLAVLGGAAAAATPAAATPAASAPAPAAAPTAAATAPASPAAPAPSPAEAMEHAVSTV
ncbi:uncharacterized protein K452DRAFT_340766 [Aplosporella prunicola CBS 121167]|uniref:Uncharacterized protein n=1 Tax=Aplosporella prunicola CBS 121167 TaxID=1176127 RepID=A0A6A6BU48_9PEZI|nr:uncharacterized protein K452DRAFT_340766 [Aplosporella prunicola CBS 121167]KAF2146161.1 hypothetical protein K452DRAFT_340766 [Aplosporella prunicola CBS 121167]